MKKYVNATEGAIIYGISKSRIMVLASEAGAVYKVGNSALINTDMRSINEQCVRQLNGEVDESEIQNIMRYGRSDIDDEYFAIIKAEVNHRPLCEKTVYRHCKEQREVYPGNE